MAHDVGGAEIKDFVSTPSVPSVPSTPSAGSVGSSFRNKDRGSVYRPPFCSPLAKNVKRKFSHEVITQDYSYAKEAMYSHGISDQIIAHFCFKKNAL